MVRSFTQGSIYIFKGLNGKKIKAIWTGDIIKWTNAGAILKMKDLNKEGVYYNVPDNLIIKEVV